MLNRKHHVLLLFVLPAIALVAYVRSSSEALFFRSGDVQLVHEAYTMPQSMRAVAMALPSACTLLTVVSPYCSVCARMRSSWDSTTALWAMESNANLSVLWLTTAKLDETKKFMRNTNAQNIPLYTVHDESPGGFRPLRIRGTPTTLLLDAQGNELARVLGEGMPEKSILERECSAG